MREAQLQGIIMMQAVGVAFGTVKQQDFKKFLDKLTGETKSAASTIDEIKQMGIPVEEK